MQHTYLIFNIRFALLLLTVFWANGILSAQGNWEFVGQPNLSNGPTTGNHAHDLAFSSTGEPYVVYTGLGLGLTVKKYNGTQWETLGLEGFATPFFQSFKMDLELDDTDTPYVAFRDSSGTSISVMRFDGFGWSYVGQPGFANSSEDPALGIINSTPFVAYSDDDAGQGISVQIFSGGTWLPIGTDIAGQPVEQVNIEISSNNTPFLAFNSTAPSGGVSVYFLDGPSWVLIGAPNFVTGVSSLDLAISDDFVPYVAFQDSNNDARVMRTRFPGDPWDYVGGNQSFTANDFAGNTSIDIAGTTPYIGYIDFGGMSVQKFENDEWQPVGEEPFTPGDAANTTLALNDDVLFAAFDDFANSFGTSVMAFQPCNNFVDLVIELDNFPQETTWSVVNEAGDTVANGGSYTGQNFETIVESLCLETGCYVFTINDSAADGLCCGFGDGGYALIAAQGDTLAMGGEFTISETTPFCVAPTEELPKAFIVTPDGQEISCFSPTITLDGSLSVSENPLLYQWRDGSGQVISNGPILTVETAGAYTLIVTDEVNLEFDNASIIIPQTGDPENIGITVNITLDNFAEETTLFIFNSNGDTLFQEGPFIQNVDDGQTFNYPLCLPSGCYDFVINDSFGDGICCNEGNGSYSVVDENGNILAEGGEFAFSETTNFCLTDPFEVGIFTPNTTLDCNNPTTELLATVSNATGTVNFEWFDEGGSSLSTAFNLVVSTPGIYTVQGTDTNTGSVDEATIVINENVTAPVIQNLSSPTTVLDCDTQEIPISPIVSISMDSLLYNWSTGADTESILVDAPGTYSVTVTFIETGCTDTAFITIAENLLLPDINIDAPTTQLDCNTSSITLDASGSAGQGALSYEWGTVGGGLSPNARYAFEDNTEDSAGANDATAANGPSYAAGQVGQAIDLDGDDDYVVLPSGMFDAYNDFTFAAWVNWDGPLSSRWERIFDFGNSTSQYMFLTPNGFPNEFRFAITTSGTGGEQRLETGALPINEWVHVAVVLNGNTGTLYLNGVVVDSGTITIDPSDVAPMFNYLGRSQFPDPYFDGQIDDVQIFNTALTLSEINQVLNGATGSTSSTLEVNAPGDYSVTVTDGANGCTAVETITITENLAPPSASIDAPATQLDCNLSSITLDAGGSTGQGALSYAWTGGSTSPILEVSTPGTYSVTVTDAANGCTSVESIVITQDITPPAVMVDTDPSTVLTCEVGSIQLAGSFSDVPFALVQWSTGSGEDVISVSSPGVYTYSVTNLDNGCVSTVDVSITESLAEPAATINAPFTELNCTTPSITLDASASSGQGALSYEWLGGNTGPTLEAAIAGTYIVTVTDAVNGCTSEASFTVTENFSTPTAAIDAPTTQLDCNVSSIVLDATGSTGQSTLSYEWIGGTTGSTLEVMTGGSYSVTVTDTQNGCTSSATVIITENFLPPIADITAPTTQLDCTSGSIVLDATGSTGQGALSYEWTGGSTNATLEVAVAGDYSVTVTDAANGCTDVSTITITQDANVPLSEIDAPTTQLDCNVSSITLDASGSTGQSPLSYEWTGGSTGATFQVSMGGSYSVTVTDTDNGCTSSSTIVITENFVAPTASINAQTTQLDCNTSSILLNASGSTGQGTLSYLWEIGSMGTTLNVGSADTYSVTVTDAANGCSSVGTITITENFIPPTPSIETPTTQLDCEFASIGLNASNSSGQGVLEYEWSDGSNGTSFNVSSPGDYFLTVTDAANGCIAVDSISISENLVPPNAVIDAAITELNCFNGSVILDASPSSGQSALSYEWSDGSAGQSLTVTAGGDYFVTVTDAANSCTAVSSIAITENVTPPTVVVDAATTELDCNTSNITLDASSSSGQGILSYEWTGGSTASTLDVSAAGDYSVTVTDQANGCSDISTVTITQDEDIPTASINAPSTQLDCNTSSILLDASTSMGQGTLSYEWSGGSSDPTLEVNAGGTYSVTVTDAANGCLAENSITITENYTDPIAVIEAPTTQLDCSMNSVALDASTSIGQGALSYEWTGGSTNASLNVTAGGSYSVTITDSVNGCTDVTTITINQDFNAPTSVIDATSTLLDCNESSITLDAFGSTGQDTLLYQWTGGSTDPTLDVNTGGSYSVTVTDIQNGCTSVASIVITEDFVPPTLEIDVPTAQLDCNTSNILLDASLSSGQGTLSFEWSDGTTDPELDVNAPGDYTVTVVDSDNGCTAVETIAITENLTAPTAVINAATTQLNCTVSSILLDASPSSGQGTLSFQWDDGSNSENITVTTEGVYGLTITDSANGCTDSTDITITEDITVIIPNVSSNAPVCQGENLQLFNDNDVVQWQWEGPDGFISDQQNPTIASVTAAAEGTYSVTVTDASGCTAVGTVDVAIDLPPDLEAFTSAPVCPGEDLELTAIVEDNILALTWITPDGDSLFNANTTVPGTDVVEGVYTLAYTGLNGCSATEQFDVAVLTEASIESNFLVGGFVCAGDSLRFIEFSGFEDDEGITFSWDFGNGDTSTERDPIYAYSQSGVYEISLVVNGGGTCPPITINKTVEVLACLQQGGEAPEVKASVNPTVSTGQFELQASLPEKGSLGLSIFTLSGQLVHQEQFSEVKELKTDFSLKDNGMYILRLSHDYGITTLRAIVIR